MKKSISGKRIIEVDILRSVALVLMVSYHIVFNLSYYFASEADPYTGLWMWIGRLSATLFLILVGLSFSLSYRKRSALSNKIVLHKKYFIDGLKVFSFGMLITLATWLLDSTLYIGFGILHFIGVSKIILPLFTRFHRWNYLFILIFLLSGFALESFYVESTWWFWLGFKYTSFVSLDYYPLFPWLGYVLLGYVGGELVYKNSVSYITIDSGAFQNICRLVSKHSLYIYLFHQPVILALMYMFYKLS